MVAIERRPDRFGRLSEVGQGGLVWRSRLDQPPEILRTVLLTKSESAALALSREKANKKHSRRTRKTHQVLIEPRSGSFHFLVWFSGFFRLCVLVCLFSAFLSSLVVSSLFFLVWFFSGVVGWAWSWFDSCLVFIWGGGWAWSDYFLVLSYSCLVIFLAELSRPLGWWVGLAC